MKFRIQFRVQAGRRQPVVFTVISIPGSETYFQMDVIGSDVSLGASLLLLARENHGALARGQILVIIAQADRANYAPAIDMVSARNGQKLIPALSTFTASRLSPSHKKFAPITGHAQKCG